MDQSHSQNRQPLSDDRRVIRLARKPKDYLEKGNVLAVQLDDEFLLSSADKESTPPHLSVWDDQLTTLAQAYDFLRENNPNSPRDLALFLSVYDIRRLVDTAGEGHQYEGLLNVIWVHLSEQLRYRPGGKGHAGIVGVDEASAPPDLTRKQKKLLRKDLRSKLAELASKKHQLLNTET